MSYRPTATTPNSTGEGACGFGGTGVGNGIGYGAPDTGTGRGPGHEGGFGDASFLHAKVLEDAPVDGSGY